ncbi:hypothetical protein GPS47_11520 [Acinetobacter haemolyticus]|uniref:hypothetical protein n=1 Tax=Acinetobacter haemolyticus TaxID=29430 RepID=UPI000E572326|nr:hypothetical protein [Acinetobacter haemolyticus]NAS06213.1 hypothetical protein [Acinetobacter haemolyticus]QDJ92682.1 hypothetical protein AhaeAN54_011660 [Acinetobacter haemolyticus]
MSTPEPKSKLDEVAEIIYRDSDNLELSEFQATRLLRMTREGEKIDPIRAKKHRMMIYYLSGQYANAKIELISLIPYAKQNIDLYIQLIAVALRIGAFIEISKIVSEVDLATLISSSKGKRKELLADLGAPFCLIGDFSMGVSNIERIEEAMGKTGYDDLKINLDSSKHMLQVYELLKLDKNKIKNLMEVVEDMIAFHKIRIFGVLISTPDDEVLIDLGVNQSIENIVRLNDELFDKAFDLGLANELTALSLNFTPVDMDQLKYAIV